MSKGLEKTDKRGERGLAQAVELMKVLGHPVRLSILCNLIHRGEMNAGDIVEAEKSRASQSQVSQYLGVFRDMGYVRTRREGQVIYYAVSDEVVKTVVGNLYDTYCRNKKRGKGGCPG